MTLLFASQWRNDRIDYGIVSGFDRGKESLFKDIDSSLQYINFSAFSFDISLYNKASEDADAAWRALGVSDRFFIVPQAFATEFSISDDHVLLLADGKYIETGGYPVNMQVLHQLHCVDFIRQSLWFNYGYYEGRAAGPFADPEINQRAHVAHCIDMLREQIMCNADTGVVPYYWKNRRGDTLPDFGLQRQCRNFDSVKRWVDEHQIFLPDGYYPLTPPSNARFACDALDGIKSPDGSPC